MIMKCTTPRVELQKGWRQQSFVPRHTVVQSPSPIHRNIKTLRCRDAVFEPQTTSNSAIQEVTRTQEQTVSSEPFDWSRQWYPVATVADLDPARPHPTTVLNKKLVLWRDADGQWRAFRDSCPHRLAALSEGRVEDGILQCAYHGYEFNAAGACIKIPHASTDDAQTRALASPRACAEAFPTKVVGGILYVWPDSASADQAVATEPLSDRFSEQEETQGEVLTVVKPFMSLVPYDYETLLENVADPGHVPFAHDGVQGSRAKVKRGLFDLASIPTDSLANGSTPHVLGVTLPGFSGQQTLTYDPPCRLQYTLPMGKLAPGKKAQFTIFATPVSPGVSRICISIRANAKPFMLSMMSKKPRWFDHAFERMDVLDGDGIFLHHLEQDMVEQHKQHGATWKSLYWLPTQADLMVTKIRNWLDDPSKGNGGPWGPDRYAAWRPRITDRRVLLDRYNSHTKHCAACRAAHARATMLSTFTAWSAIITAAASLMAGLLTLQGSVSVQPVLLWGTAVAAGVLGLVSKVAENVRTRFEFTDYVHADR